MFRWRQRAVKVGDEWAAATIVRLRQIERMTPASSDDIGASLFGFSWDERRTDLIMRVASTNPRTVTVSPHIVGLLRNLDGALRRLLAKGLPPSSHDIAHGRYPSAPIGGLFACPPLSDNLLTSADDQPLSLAVALAVRS